MLRPLVLLGMPQSGASLLAGALSQLGVSFGDEALLFAPAPDDPGGRFEQRALNQFNHVCLNAFQMHTASVSPMPANWASHPLGVVLLKDLKSILARSIQPDRRWGIRLPTASLLMPMYRAAFEELGVRPHYVVCVRNPVFFVDAKIRWAHGPGSRAVSPLGDLAIGVWMRYTLGALERATADNFSVVLFEDLWVRPEAVLDRIVGVDSSWSPTNEVRLNRELGRTVEGGLENYPAFVSETYDVCRRLAAGEGCFERLEGVIEEFGLWREIFARPGIPGTRVGLAWTEHGEVRTAQVPFLPSGDWQTVRLNIGAPANTSLSGLLYGQPCRVWIRRCVWLVSGREETVELSAGPGSHIQTLQGVIRLDGAYESGQISLRTSQRPGPYTLEIEFLLEAGPQLSAETAHRLSERLRKCIAMNHQISSEGKR